MTEATAMLDEVRRVTNEALIAGLKRLVRADQMLSARLLLHLGEVEERGLYRDQAYPSMFAYCVEELGMFENQAYLRIQVARLGRRFPRVVELLAQGELTLTSVKQLAPHLTDDNHVRLLEQARGKRTREIELLLAAVAPKPDVPSRMRKLPERAQGLSGQVTPKSVEATPEAFVLGSPVTAPINAAQGSPIGASSAPIVAPGICGTNPAPFLTVPSATPLLGASDAPLENVSAPSGALFANNPTATQPLHTADAPSRDACDPGGAVSANHLAATPSPHGTGRPSRGLGAPRGAVSANHLAATRSLEAREASVDGTGDSNRAVFALEPPRSRGSSKPLSPGRYKVEFTAGQGLHDKLVQLQELLRHQVPDGDLAVVVERAVDLLLENTTKQRFAQTRAPKKQQSSPKLRKANSRYVPRAVVREVHQRDAGQCTFVSEGGRRCTARGFLELHHHDEPYARGGKATVKNLRLVCHAHNALFAERDYGRTFMHSKRTQTSARSNERVSKTSSSSMS